MPIPQNMTLNWRNGYACFNWNSEQRNFYHSLRKMNLITVEGLFEFDMCLGKLKNCCRNFGAEARFECR